MYTSYYNLSSRPFQLSPNHRFFFGSKGHRRAMAYLTYGLHQREGFIVITGDVGTGKTTLVDYLADQLSAGPFVVGRVSAGQVEAPCVLGLVAKSFQLPTGEPSQAELQQQIEQFLITRQRTRHRPILVVDEAQNWPLPALEELRVLANLHHGGKALLQILLVGQPQFRDALGEPDYEQLRQRVVASHHLETLDQTEIGPYIEHRLKQVGWQGDPVFETDACSRIYEHCHGVPRRINLVCSRILVLGALEESHVIDDEAVQEVLEELDQEGARYEPTPAAQEVQNLGAPAIDDPALPALTDGRAAGGSPLDAQNLLLNGSALSAPALSGMALGESSPLIGSTCGKTEEEIAFDRAPDDDQADGHWGDIDHWRREAVRLLQKLEETHDDLSAERRRIDAVRMENEELRDRLHRMELEQTRQQADAAQRSAAVLLRSAPSRATIFRRFGSN